MEKAESDVNVVTNFLPKGKSQVICDAYGGVQEIIGICPDSDGQEKKICYRVSKAGKLYRCVPEGFPKFTISEDIKKRLLRQFYAIVHERSRKAYLAKTSGRLDWNTLLKNKGATILSNGKIQIYRAKKTGSRKKKRLKKEKIQIYRTKTKGDREKIRQEVRDINAAIRQQADILNTYKPKPAPPHIEPRRQALIEAKKMMIDSLEQAILKISDILSSITDTVMAKLLAEKIGQVEYFLKNSWPCPFAEDVRIAITLLHRAKIFYFKDEVIRGKARLEYALLSLQVLLEYDRKNNPDVSDQTKKVALSVNSN